ncbi:mannitol-1-phosphate 5-dehydrogenase [Staphylococcus americanisciuri]|uniref:Mannitol-1-phosphate 5-dehydrogenase n=1 Tax=Staphylococcus americanisciuri TaxID=2973940 RepID=A0ABT2F5B4_9STAP|nr:mannitol-1-phosphate 5-dehydrogenase [Staphylococcus americanisciuri]MCS4486987.1 mannitol-1-phosphate 5-dehydrogenase [Staphylococcus americanisciuri]
MKALHFGAGNIGRGFIGLILSNNNYHITFADVNEAVVDALKTQQQFNVTLANPEQTTTTVTNVTGLHSIQDQQDLEKAIESADLITTAVGVNILPIVAKTLAPILKKRTTHVNVVACENAINATDRLAAAIRDLVGDLPENIHFSNAAVDRIVPAQTHDNILDVTVEPFFEWAIEAPTWYGKQLADVTYVDDLAPYIERKLLTVNTGHAYLAYAGQYYNHQTILEATQDTRVTEGLVRVLSETSHYITSQFDIDINTQAQYRKKIIERFYNPNLSDDIVRVGRGVLRKLGPEDRIMKPLNVLVQTGQPHDELKKLAAFALAYQDEHDAETIEKDKQLADQGATVFLQNHSHVDKTTAEAINRIYQAL